MCYLRFVIATSLDSFLQFKVFISSLTAEIIWEILICSGGDTSTYPPLAPLTLLLGSLV